VRAEPIAADIRPGGDGKRLARLKLVAGLTGLRLDELVQREAQRRVRRLAAIAIAAVVGMILAASLALYANARRIEANDQRAIAEREAAAARAASDYLVGTFALSNPATENPRTITAVTILHRSADRARTELADQPLLQSRLIATLARAYYNLGLFPEARDAIRRSWPAIRASGIDGVPARLLLANAEFKLGRMEQGLALVAQVERELGPDEKLRPDLRALAAVTKGMVLTGLGRPREGIQSFDHAVALYRSMPKPDQMKIADVLQNKGLLLSDDGQFSNAEKSLQQALAINRRARGEHHLITGQVWFALAQNAFLAGELSPAEQRVANALAIERQVLDPDNPIIGDALSMQGQIYQGQNRLIEAQRSLTEAIAIYRKAYGGPHYLIGIAEVYLALIESARGRTDAALRVLDDAKHNYDVSYATLHPNHGDLLVNRATILARAGRIAEARADCASGLKILGQTLGPDANYTRTMAKTCEGLVAKPAH
jgi:tetratricopeptide (TPR) repeat protein